VIAACGEPDPDDPIGLYLGGDFCLPSLDAPIPS
jgi:hypothetical protein